MNRSYKINNKEYLYQNIIKLDGVGNKIKNLLKKKGIEKISDLLWHLPQDCCCIKLIKNIIKSS